jgi:hypothetical protein
MKTTVASTMLLIGLCTIFFIRTADAGSCSFGPGILTSPLQECSFSCNGDTFIGSVNLSGVGASIVMFCGGTIGAASCSVIGGGSGTGTSCSDLDVFEAVNDPPPVSCICEVNRGAPPAALVLSAGCSCP